MRVCFSLDVPIDSRFSLTVPTGTRFNSVFYTIEDGPQLNCDAPDTYRREVVEFFMVPHGAYLPTDALTVFVGQFQTTPHGQLFSIFMALNRKAA